MPTAPAPRARVSRHAPVQVAGGWKLAYADFLTALAAFFLVMWLVKAMPESRRAELAGYFDGGPQSTTGLLEPETPGEAALLKRALEAVPAIRRHPGQVAITETAEGLRIDLMDLSGRPLFETGRDQPTPEGEALVMSVFSSLRALPWPVSLEGHTDAFPYQNGTGSNWSLSLDRADRTRQLALAAGIKDARLRAVTGYGASRPRLPRQPHHPTNRRVTVILHVPPLYSNPVSS